MTNVIQFPNKKINKKLNHNVHGISENAIQCLILSLQEDGVNIDTDNEDIEILKFVLFGILDKINSDETSFSYMLDELKEIYFDGS